MHILADEKITVLQLMRQIDTNKSGYIEKTELNNYLLSKQIKLSRKD